MLSNCRVLDLTNEKGLLCGRILADIGADVIKVEKPCGDAARRIGPFYHNIPDSEKSLYWFFYDANKRGITLNLEKADGREIFNKLVEQADFVIESFDPGYLDELGLSYQKLSRINPHLIMISVSPFGQQGPHCDYKANDLICNARSGLMYITGDSDRAPLRVSAEQAYVQAGAQAAAAGMVAHWHQLMSGEGQHVDISIQESVAIATTGVAMQSFWNFASHIIPRHGSKTARGNINVELLYPCKDGYVCWRVIVGPMGRQTAALVEWMNSEGTAGELDEVNWIEEDMLKIAPGRWSHWEELFSKFFLHKTKTELFQEAIKREIWLFPVNSPKDVFENVQLSARGFWLLVNHPELGETITYPGIPIKSSEFLLGIKRRAPLIGEHNREIYEEELGLTKEELILLKQGDII